MKPPRAALDALIEGRNADPFALLGPHEGPGGTFLRALVPGAEEVAAFDLSGTSLGELQSVDPRGLFE